MNKVRITAIRQTVYSDLMAKYENPIEHTCDVMEGQQWMHNAIIDAQRIWYNMRSRKPTKGQSHEPSGTDQGEGKARRQANRAAGRRRAAHRKGGGGNPR